MKNTHYCSEYYWFSAPFRIKKYLFHDKTLFYTLYYIMYTYKRIKYVFILTSRTYWHTNIVVSM